MRVHAMQRLMGLCESEADWSTVQPVLQRNPGGRGGDTKQQEQQKPTTKLKQKLLTGCALKWTILFTKATKSEN